MIYGKTDWCGRHIRACGTFRFPCLPVYGPNFRHCQDMEIQVPACGERVAPGLISENCSAWASTIISDFGPTSIMHRKDKLLSFELWAKTCSLYFLFTSWSNLFCNPKLPKAIYILPGSLGFSAKAIERCRPKQGRGQGMGWLWLCMQDTTSLDGVHT